MHQILSFLTDFGDTAVTIPLAMVLTLFFLAARQPRLAVGWAVVICGCAGTVAALKLVFRVCGHPLAGSRLMSPSGHTAMSIAVYGGLAAVVGYALKPPARAALAVAAAVFTITIALSRTIVGYHTPIEVLVGLVVGAVALAAMLAVVAHCRPPHLPLRWLVAGAIAVFAVFHGTRWPAEEAIHGLAWFLEALRPYCS